MTLYGQLADLSLVIDEMQLEVIETETASGFTRSTTIVSFDGDGHRGRGEDVTYETEIHHQLCNQMPEINLRAIETLDEFHQAIETVDLLDGLDPGQTIFRNYRQWAFESAALDLALKQSGESLADRLDQNYNPVNFVVSPSLGSPPSPEAVNEWLKLDPTHGFKLDPSDGWTDELIDELAAMNRVKILDLKGLYDDPEVGQVADFELYSKVLTSFPTAIIEDPGVDPSTEELLAAERDRISWDYPIRGPNSIDECPWSPQWLNIKPSRFGSVRLLLATIERAFNRGINLYGGGQFELGIGREQLHTLASLFYPDGPNDVAPSGYNQPGYDSTLPSSPLSPPENPIGLDWH